MGVAKKMMEQVMEHVNSVSRGLAPKPEFRRDRTEEPTKVPTNKNDWAQAPVKAAEILHALGVAAAPAADVGHNPAHVYTPTPMPGAGAPAPSPLG